MNSLNPLLAFAVTAASAVAQIRSGERDPFDPETVVMRAVVLADVDGDGSLDALVAWDRKGDDRMIDAACRVLQNDGKGVFTDQTSRWMPVEASLTQSLAAGDIDGDGRVDLVLGFGGGSGKANRLYRNTPDDRFRDITANNLPTDTGITARILAADFDGDGDLDLLFGNTTDAFGREGQNNFYLNAGDGRFGDATTASLPPGRDATSAMVCCDFDGDGDLDVVLGNSNGPDIALRNDGKGRFGDATTDVLPYDNQDTRSLAFGDVDGDGDLDLIVGHATSRGRGQDRLLLNDGSGRFSDATALRLPPDEEDTSALALIDVDGDGDLDLIGGYFGSQDRLYRNDGAGRFTDTTVNDMPANERTTMALAYGDLDGDGDIDLLFADHAQGIRMYRNDGKGRFLDASDPCLPAGGLLR
jgi:hypothetical protein